MADVSSLDALILGRNAFRDSAPSLDRVPQRQSRLALEKHNEVLVRFLAYRVLPRVKGPRDAAASPRGEREGAGTISLRDFGRCGLRMKTAKFLGVLGAVMARVTLANAQQPTAYIPRSPIPGAETARCTPPPGGICSTSIQASSITSPPGFFPTWPATVRPDQSQGDSATALLTSLQSSWSAQPNYTALAGEVYVVAPAEAQYSLAVYGWNWDHIVRSEWYNGGTYNDSGTMVNYVGVTKSWKEAVVWQELVLQKGFDGILGLSSEANRVRVAGFGRVVPNGVMLGWILILMAWIGVWETL
ncbi:hypothetical protein N431DRAFT_449576 [Stipitochalara longipes BDJ]|nr:hypothetical protein N431DRAFT_449576 [Stipitochalara longipes BDJ]